MNARPVCVAWMLQLESLEPQNSGLSPPHPCLRARSTAPESGIFFSAWGLGSWASFASAAAEVSRNPSVSRGLEGPSRPRRAPGSRRRGLAADDRRQAPAEPGAGPPGQSRGAPRAGRVWQGGPPLERLEVSTRDLCSRDRIPFRGYRARSKRSAGAQVSRKLRSRCWCSTRPWRRGARPHLTHRARLGRASRLRPPQLRGAEVAEGLRSV